MKRISEYLEVIDEGGKKVIRCRCGYSIGPASENYKKNVFQKESPLSAAGPHINPHNIGVGGFVFRQFCCPGCFTLLGTEIALKGDPLLWDIQPKL